MGITMVDVTLHIDQNSSASERDGLREQLLEQDGVLAADFGSNTPHLVIIEYDPDKINSSAFVELAKNNGLHAELVGL
ncbi:MAG: ATP-binding protein [Gammaproteobacteria bacterium]|nr:ATP-binding protein [Gammaproteobacteria bacterium]MDH5728312.1 ATP-binding protein [Gammaproteobacteria bacterium]